MKRTGIQKKSLSRKQVSEDLHSYKAVKTRLSNAQVVYKKG